MFIGLTTNIVVLFYNSHRKQTMPIIIFLASGFYNRAIIINMGVSGILKGHSYSSLEEESKGPLKEELPKIQLARWGGLS